MGNAGEGGGGREQSVQVENATRSERAAERKGTVDTRGGVRPVEVQVGISDGAYDGGRHRGRGVEGGDQVVVGVKLLPALLRAAQPIPLRPRIHWWASRWWRRVLR